MYSSPIPLPPVRRSFIELPYAVTAIHISLLVENDLRLPEEITNGFPGISPHEFYEMVILKKLPKPVIFLDTTKVPPMIPDTIKLPRIVRLGYGIQSPREFFNRVWFGYLPSFEIGKINETHCGRRLRRTDSFASVIDPARPSLRKGVFERIRGIPGGRVYDMVDVFIM